MPASIPCFWCYPRYSTHQPQKPRDCLLLAVDLVNNRAKARETLRVLFKKRGLQSSKPAALGFPALQRPASHPPLTGPPRRSSPVGRGPRLVAGDLSSVRRTPGAASRTTHGIPRRAGCAAPGSRARLLTPGPRKTPVRGLRSRLPRASRQPAPPPRTALPARPLRRAPAPPSSSAPPSQPAPPAAPVRAPGPPVTWAARVTWRPGGARPPAPEAPGSGLVADPAWGAALGYEGTTSRGQDFTLQGEPEPEGSPANGGAPPPSSRPAPRLFQEAVYLNTCFSVPPWPGLKALEGKPGHLGQADKEARILKAVCLNTFLVLSG